MNQLQKKHKHANKKLAVSARKIARLAAYTSLPEIALLSSLIFGRYLKNADFNYPGEIILPILVLGLVATVVFYAYKWVLKDRFAARFAALALSYSIYAFSDLPTGMQSAGNIFLPRSWQTDFSTSILSVLLLAIFYGALGYGLYQLFQNKTVVKNLQPHKVVLFALLFVFSLQSYKVASYIFKIHDQMAFAYPAPEFKRGDKAAAQKPDIYYFVYDRYGNNENLKNAYNFDNSDLTNWLAGQGFTNRLDANANYPFTMSSISSTLAMKYHTELGKQFGNEKTQTAFPYRSILNDPPVAQILKQNGYTYNQVSSWWDFTRVGIKADNNPTISFRLQIMGTDHYLSDLSRDIFNKSALASWLKKGLSFGSHPVIKYDLARNPRQNFYDQQAAIKQLAGSKNSTPQFTFAHFLAPHDPYIFDADGSDPSYNGSRNDVDLDETVKYTKEITYLNTQIKDMMGYIRQQSPGAVIIIQSDEGPYPKQFRFELSPAHYYDPSDLALAQQKLKFGILASYYMPGVDPAIVSSEVTSSVNPFRFILKHYLGYDVPMLPDCQFSTGDKYVVYKFKNETGKFRRGQSEICNKY